MPRWLLFCRIVVYIVYFKIEGAPPVEIYCNKIEIRKLQFQFLCVLNCLPSSHIKLFHLRNRHLLTKSCKRTYTYCNFIVGGNRNFIALNCNIILIFSLLCATWASLVIVLNKNSGKNWYLPNIYRTVEGFKTIA